MTLDTRVYVHNPVDYCEVWIKCNQLIDAHEGVKFTDEPVPEYAHGERLPANEAGEWWIWNKPGQGLSALLDIHYRKDRALILPGEHGRYCEPEDDCDGSCAPACWLEVSFDTAYGYRGDNGEGCGDLHARLVAELGQWLDGKGLRWSWVNEFTGDTHWGYEGLTDLGSGGAEASSWYRNIVAPAIAAITAGGAE